MSEDDEQSPALFDRLCSLLGEPKARELAQELYGLGYYILPRKGDTFELAKAPPGVSYQWILAGKAKEAEARGWAPVPHSRYEGVYAPIGYPGEIAHKGLILMERDAAVTDAVRAAEIAKAHQNVDDWFARAAGGGFSGGVRISYGNELARERSIGDTVVARKVMATTPFGVSEPAPRVPPPPADQAEDVPQWRDTAPPRRGVFAWLHSLFSVEKT